MLKMRRELEYLEVMGKKYPIRCDLFALQKIQDRFGSIEEFEKKLIGENHIVKRGTKKAQEPDVKAVMEAAVIMIEEGNQYLKEEGEQPVEFSKREFLRDLTVTDMLIMQPELHKEFGRCFQTKKP